MLTGEYAVLDGATALALPTKGGQRMTIKKSRSSDLIWEALDKDGNVWFSSTISLYDFGPIKTTDEAVSAYLKKLLKNAARLNSEFLNKWAGFKVETKLEFDRDWGLGSSSTLTHLVAEWAEVHPMMLHWKISAGSGYDVACSMSGSPTVFFTNDEETSYTPIDWSPSFTDQLYFVHLGRKQDSSAAVKDYLKNTKARKQIVAEITPLTEAMIAVKTIEDMEDICQRHNAVIMAALGHPDPKSGAFSDYHGVIKPLGAWGGDFVLATSHETAEKTMAYFSDKGYPTVLSYKDMIRS